MNVLIVEDNKTYLETLEEIARGLIADLRLSVCKNAANAIKAVRSEFFDVVVLDMSIPADSGISMADPAHGMSVLTEIQENAPGTPVFVLTGSPAREYGHHVADLVDNGAKADIWGDGVERQLVRFNLKRDLLRFKDQLKEYVESYSRIRDVEVDRGTLKLPEGFDRLIRIFCRSQDIWSCSVSQISSGLSGTPVYKLDGKDQQGNLSLKVIAKMGLLADIRDEAQRYERFANRLSQGATPRKLRMQRYGGGKNGSVFYSLAKGHEETIFSIVSDATRIAEAVKHLEATTSEWASRAEKRSVGDIRRTQISDEKFAPFREETGIADIDAFEQKTLITRWACTHGDLHGENVLVNAQTTTLLIDFGDMSDGPASRDPITLELSALCHASGPLRGSGWPGEAARFIFVDQDAYLQDCPAKEFVVACRKWAANRANGKREQLAVAYAYLVRQFKYPDTDKALLRDLLAGVVDSFNQT